MKSYWDAVKQLGTLPGWLNLYDVEEIHRTKSSDCIGNTIDDAIKEAEKELEHLSEGRSPKAREVFRLLEFDASWRNVIRMEFRKTLSAAY